MRGTASQANGEAGTSIDYQAATGRRIYSDKMSSALATSLPAISPLLEMGAYEALWAEKGASFKTIAERFRARRDSLPSDFVMTTIAEDFGNRALSILTKAGVTRFGVRITRIGCLPTARQRARRGEDQRAMPSGTTGDTQGRSLLPPGEIARPRPASKKFL